MLLREIRDVFRGEKNDVLICRDENSPTLNCYVLLVVKDRACAKKLVSVFEDNERAVPGGRTPYILCFSENELLFLVFDYRPERRLGTFGEAQMDSLFTREKVCVNIIMECLSSILPYPLLYLVLTQDNIHIERDNSIYFTTYFDLSELDEEKDEKSCAARCAEILISILEAFPGRRPKSLMLISRKLDRAAYQSLPELYIDLKATSVKEEKRNFRAALKELWVKMRDRLFRVLLAACIVLVAISLLFLVSQLIFGDIPILRIFENSFDVIGTESLKG